MFIKRYPTKKIQKSADKPSQTQILSPTIKVRSEKEIIMASKHGEILYKIWGLESSWGRNDGCRDEGKFGGFGIMSEGKVMCYDTFEKSVERAEYWLTKLGVDKDMAKALCLWNTGVVMVNCSYYQAFLTL